MRLAQVLSNPTSAGAGRIRALVAALGTLVAVGCQFLGPVEVQGIALSFVPAILVILTLLSGWRLAAVSALTVVATGLLAPLPATWETAALATVAVLSGEALRRGIRPVVVVAAVLLCGLFGEIAALTDGTRPADLYKLASATVQAAFSVSLATTALVLMPRRGMFPTRRRIRWDHLLFVLIVGTASATTLGILAGTGLVPAQETAQDARNETPVALTMLAIAAIAASCALTFWCEALSRNLPQRYRRHSHRNAAKQPPLGRSRELPWEIAGFLAGIARDRNHLRHDAERHHRDLLKLRQSALRMQQELRELRDTLQSQSAELQMAIQGSEIMKADHQALMEGSPEVCIFADSKGVIRSASRMSKPLLGYEPTTLTGEPVSILVPIEHVLDHPLEQQNTQASPPAPGNTQCHVRIANGKSREVAVQVRHFQIGGETHRLILMRESDNMKKALATLEQAKELSRSASRSRDLFIATMSHEMRTPLHGLIATLEMMRSGEPTTDFQHQLAIARTSARALLKIANDVLDLTRIGSSLFQLERQIFGMPKILGETVDEAQARATSLGLRVSARVKGKLPPSFIGDPARLKQILGNLVSNALKFTTQGGVTIRVVYDGKQCVIDVTDTGEGIPVDKRDSIFEPFVQLPSHSRSQVGGTGLGLPICRRLAEAMGGSLVLLRSDPQGSTFRLTLPLESSDEQPQDEQSQRVFRNPSGRILIVEDNPANRYVAQALLAGLDCPATIVESGHEALELLRHQEFDLILMDCQLPVMDGYETTRRARRILKRRIPIVAMTANAMAEEQKACIEAGMDDFLPKPFGRQALSALLCKWLSPGAAHKSGASDPDARLGMLPDLDISVLDELWESLRWQPGPLKQIRSTFGQLLEQTLPLLVEAPQADRAKLLRQLHTVLGSAGMVGARQIEYLAGRIQAAAKEQRLEELKGAAEILERAMRRYEREFEHWFQNGGGQGRTVRLHQLKTRHTYA